MTIIGNVNVRGYTTQYGSTTGGNYDAGVNNDSYYMRHVDVDGTTGDNAVTFNSSSATLNLPVSQDSILWAGLYWQSYSNSNYQQSNLYANRNSQRYKIRFRKGTGAYTQLTSTQNDLISTYDYRGYYAYQGFFDVTALVKAGGNGDYFVGSIVTPYAEYGVGAGWSMVVIYKDFSGSPLRNIVAWDGYQAVQPGTTVNINLSGFKTPVTGAVQSNVGVVAFEGDDGLTNDRLRLGPTSYLSDWLNPSTNVFNSSITELGSRVTAKNPDFTNQLGYDIDILSTNGILANNSTSTTVRLETNGDLYYPGVVTFNTDISGAAVTTEKMFFDPGSNTLSTTRIVTIPPNTIDNRTVQYQFKLESIGEITATSVRLIDTIPMYQDYITGSMQTSMNGTTWTNVSDANDGDAGYYDSGLKRVIMGIGNSATSTNGGQMLPGAVRYARFKTLIQDPVNFNPPPPNLYEIPNFAAAFYQDTASYNYESNSNGVLLSIDNALPVELASFTAKAKSSDAVLDWTTVTESNNYGFEIERRATEGAWTMVGFVAGNGTVNSPKTYAFTDIGAAQHGSKLQYRLRQIDRGGSYTHSSVVEVSFLSEGGTTLSAAYPNPVTSNAATSVSFTLAKSATVSLAVYDIFGNEVASLTEGQHAEGTYAFTLYTRTLPVGMYYIELRTGSQRLTRKLVVR
ncbi:MAG: T9SS type A sorting domain-containing protein [Ignavibacteria bacterium]|nr:T9SS type A sorting domain-containing protein [Ignavibacteria bacterium]